MRRSAQTPSPCVIGGLLELLTPAVDDAHPVVAEH